MSKANDIQKLKEINLVSISNFENDDFTKSNNFLNSFYNKLDIYEILNKPIPKEFQDFTMFKEEFERTVINMYPSYEKDIK